MQPEPAKTVDISAKRAGSKPALVWLKTQSSHSGQRQYDAALRTIAVLQTTLELEPLLRLFSREVNATVAHSSVQYRNPRRGVDLRVGRNAPYRRTFRLIVERHDLGRLTFTRGKLFTARETASLEFLLSSLVYPLRNALQYENAFQASLTDPLTGVSNRNMLVAALRREVSLSRRHRTPLSLIVLDIDGLKAINDAHGHQIGDDLIKAVAGCVSRVLRETDIVSRFGGDEFAILLSNTDQRGATVLAQNIRKRVEEFLRSFADGTIKATVSIGVASLASRDTDGALFCRADRALYRAKRAGRNCIRVAG